MALIWHCETCNQHRLSISDAIMRNSQYIWVPDWNRFDWADFDTTFDERINWHTVFNLSIDCVMCVMHQFLFQVSSPRHIPDKLKLASLASLMPVVPVVPVIIMMAAPTLPKKKKLEETWKSGIHKWLLDAVWSKHNIETSSINLV